MKHQVKVYSGFVYNTEDEDLIESLSKHDVPIDAPIEFEIESDLTGIPLLDLIFKAQNIGLNDDGIRIALNYPSLTAGDVVVVNDERWFCLSFGWGKMSDGLFEKWSGVDSMERLTMARSQGFQS